MPLVHSNIDGTFGYNVGDVDLGVIDIGLVKSLGGVRTGNDFVLNYIGLDANIPVIFGNPEQVLIKAIVPSMVIMRDDITFIQTPRLQREDYGYRLPATGATVITVGDVTGYSAYRTRKVGRAVDISYTIQIWHKHRDLLRQYLKSVVKRIMPHDYIIITDTIGNEGIYSAYVENVTILDDIGGVVQRFLGYGISVRVEAEINIEDEVVIGNVIEQTTINRVEL